MCVLQSSPSRSKQPLGHGTLACVYVCGCGRTRVRVSHRVAPQHLCHGAFVGGLLMPIYLTQVIQARFLLAEEPAVHDQDLAANDVRQREPLHTRTRMHTHTRTDARTNSRTHAHARKQTHTKTHCMQYCISA